MLMTNMRFFKKFCRRVTTYCHTKQKYSVISKKNNMNGQGKYKKRSKNTDYSPRRTPRTLAWPEGRNQTKKLKCKTSESRQAGITLYYLNHYVSLVGGSAVPGFFHNKAIERSL